MACSGAAPTQLASALRTAATAAATAAPAAAVRSAALLAGCCRWQWHSYSYCTASAPAGAAEPRPAAGSGPKGGSSSSSAGIDATPQRQRGQPSTHSGGGAPAASPLAGSGARAQELAGPAGGSGSSAVATGRQHHPPPSDHHHHHQHQQPQPRDARAFPHAQPPLSEPPGLGMVLGAALSATRGLLGAPGAGLQLGQMAFGLQALSRRHAEQGTTDHPAGAQPLPGGAEGQAAAAASLLESLELAHGAYRRSAAALAATSCLRAQNVLVWQPEGGRLQPGYYIAVDHARRRLVWGVRGSRVLNDLLIDVAAAAHPLGGGAAHWGMTHAAHWLLRREAARVAGLLRRCPGYSLLLVGHSLGGSVAALAAHMIRTRSGPGGLIPNAERVTCVAFAPPPAMTEQLACACRPYVTSVVLNNDIVPRINSASLAALQAELSGVDWWAELQALLADRQGQGIKRALEGVAGAWGALSLSQAPQPAAPAAALGPPAQAALPPPSSQPEPGRESDGDASGSGGDEPAWSRGQQGPPAGDTHGSGGGGGGLGPLQQLSGAVVQSAALAGALTRLEEWRDRAAAAAVAGQAEAVMRRQAELLRSWQQELAAMSARLVAGRDGSAKGGPPGGGSNSNGLPSLDLSDVQRQAEAAAERLRASVEGAIAAAGAALPPAAVSAATSLATAARERLPSLPSLPSSHELPLIPELTAAPGRPRQPPQIGPGWGPVAAAAALGEGAAAAGSGGDGGSAEGASVDASPLQQNPESSSSSSSSDVGGGSSTAAPAGDALVPSAGAEHAAPALLQNMPLLHVPGRVLYIRRDGDDPATIRPRRRTPRHAAADQPGTAPTSTSSGSATGATSAATYALLELPPGSGFRRIVLGRGALEEHQCRAYRRVLARLAQHVEL